VFSLIDIDMPSKIFLGRFGRKNIETYAKALSITPNAVFWEIKFTRFNMYLVHTAKNMRYCTRVPYSIPDQLFFSINILAKYTKQYIDRYNRYCRYDIISPASSYKWDIIKSKYHILLPLPLENVAKKLKAYFPEIKMKDIKKSLWGLCVRGPYALPSLDFLMEVYFG